MNGQTPKREWKFERWSGSRWSVYLGQVDRELLFGVQHPDRRLPGLSVGMGLCSEGLHEAGGSFIVGLRWVATWLPSWLSWARVGDRESENGDSPGAGLLVQQQSQGHLNWDRSGFEWQLCLFLAVRFSMKNFTCSFPSFLICKMGLK